MKNFLLFALLFIPCQSAAQIVFAAGASGNLYRIELSSCSVKTIGKTTIMADLALDPTTHQLYGIEKKGLYRIDTVTAKTVHIGETIDANALTFGRDGTLYAASGKNIYTINKYTGKHQRLGAIKSGISAGDLTFFKDDLYLTIEKNELVKINLDNIEKSEPMGWIGGVRSGVFHGVTAVGCKNLYGFADKDIYEIRPAGLRFAHMKCPDIIDDLIIGAASYQEAGLPDFSLGKDSFMCQGDTLKYRYNDPNARYTWRDTFNTPNYDITRPGTYWLKVEYTSCVFWDTIDISFGSKPKLDLGPDTTICPTEKLNLRAYWPGSTYKWHDSSTTSEIRVSEPGLHWVIANMQSCGSDTDSVYVSFVNELEPNLGPDQHMCDSMPITLRSNLGSTKIRWQDGSLSKTYVVHRPGTYWLKAFGDECVYVDTLKVLGNETSPSVDLGKDTAVCAGAQLKLKANVPAATYQWSNDSTTANILADSTGWYWVIATSEHCGSDTDSVYVTAYPGPKSKFASDTVLCDDDTLVLRMDLPGAFIRWLDVFEGDSFVVSGPGAYTVKARIGTCVYDDSIWVSYGTSPQLDLGPDTTLCGADHYYLAVLPSVGATYLWSDGNTKVDNIIRSSGTYWAIASTEHCGLVADTVTVELVPQKVPSLGRDTFVCRDDSFKLKLKVQHDSIIWSNGFTGPLQYATDSMSYSAKVYYKSCNYITDTLFLTTYDCNCPLYLPNAFTPTRDNLNEGFRPIHECHFSSYHLQIFNRWGQRVFESTDPLEYWKGVEGTGPDAFVYVLYYKQYDGKYHSRKGNVTVLR